MTGWRLREAISEVIRNRGHSESRREFYSHRIDAPRIYCGVISRYKTSPASIAEMTNRDLIGPVNSRQ